MSEEKCKKDRYLTVGDLIARLSEYDSGLLVQIRAIDEAECGEVEGYGLLERDTLDVVSRDGVQIEQGLDHGVIRLTIPLDMD